MNQKLEQDADMSEDDIEKGTNMNTLLDAMIAEWIKSGMLTEWIKSGMLTEWIKSSKTEVDDSKEEDDSEEVDDSKEDSIFHSLKKHYIDNNEIRKSVNWSCFPLIGVMKKDTELYGTIWEELSDAFYGRVKTQFKEVFINDSTVKAASYDEQAEALIKQKIDDSINKFIESINYSAYRTDEASDDLCGLRSWCPATDELAATTFKNVDRSVDVQSLGGIRIGAVGESMQESLISAVSQHRQYGGKPDIVLMHPSNYSKLVKELSTSVVYVNVPGKPFFEGQPSFSFRGIQLNHAPQITVLKDPACQEDVTWVIDSEEFIIKSQGTWPYVPMPSRGVLTWLESSSNYIFRLFAVLEFVCSRPASLLSIQH